MKLLTKSKYLIGLQCPKYLWIVFNEPDKVPKPDKNAQHKFDVGTQVGQLATKVYPDGIAIPEEDFKENLKQSKELLKKRKPLFEASFQVDNLYSRADILLPVGKDEWDIIEVKSGTQVKDVNVHDVSFQKYIYEKAGLKIRKCFLMHLNKEFVKKGKINIKKLFVQDDVTVAVETVIEGIGERIKEILKLTTDKNSPLIKINKNCKDPYPCPFKDKCWSFLPEHNVFQLYRSGKKSFALLDTGIEELKDIPKSYKLNSNQKTQHECANTGKIHIDKPNIKAFLKKLNYPIYHLDFETYQTAVPIHDGTKPYQQIPFQFSLHIQKKPGSKPSHFEYLSKGKEDPRKEFMKTLKKVLDKKGDIIVYNQAFEKMIIRQGAEFLPEYEKWVESINKRIVDLLIPFRKFYYYNPKQKGSCSIKKVLPALIGKSYEEMEIGDGATASLEYFNSIYGNYTKEQIENVRSNLLKYCCLDTESMVWIVDKLWNIN